MKNSTLKNLLLSLTVAPIGLLAQPTLTATGINQVIGDQITSNNTQYVSPGSAGANQTWNLSSMSSSGSGTTTIVSPASTPNGSSFSNATIAMQSGSTYAYYKTSASAWQYYGADNGSTVLAYSDPEDQLHYPFTFNNSFTDTWACTFTNTYTFYRTGSSTVTDDGYGTLTTPDGTFTGVTRVHFVQTYQDSANISSVPYVITYSNDEYMWYLNGNHYPIAAVYTLTTSAGSPITGGLYLSNVVSGIEEQNGMSSLTMFPTLASDNINFTYSVDAPSAVTISVYNEAGQLLMEIPQEAMVGENNISISVAELPAGNYFATIANGNAIPAVRKFVVSR